MTQAARSGKQNIAEGCSGQSLESYIKLLGVAEASFKELSADYEDYIRQHKLSTWSHTDLRLRQVRQFRAAWLAPNVPNTPGLPTIPEVAANTMVCLCAMETYLLSRQIAALKEKFVKEGGFRENMYQKRAQYKRRDWGRGIGDPGSRGVPTNQLNHPSHPHSPSPH